MTYEIKNTIKNEINKKIIRYRNKKSGAFELKEPCPDAVAIEFKWLTRPPLAPQAVHNAPDCVLRAKTNWGKPGIYLEKTGDIHFVCDGVYGAPIICTKDELPELLNWLDTYFADMGSDIYGGHWRTAKEAYSCRDYTAAEINRIVETETLWDTFEPFLNRKDF